MNALEEERAARLEREISGALGVSPLRRAALGALVRPLAAAWRLRLKLRGDAIQPSTIVTRYPARGRRPAGVPVVSVAPAAATGFPAALEAAAREALGAAGAPA